MTERTKLTEAQARIAVPLLNSYAHQYLGLRMDQVLISGGRNDEGWMLIVSVADCDHAVGATDFDAAKGMIDDYAGRAALREGE